MPRGYIHSISTARSLWKLFAPWFYAVISALQWLDWQFLELPWLFVYVWGASHERAADFQIVNNAACYANFWTRKSFRYVIIMTYCTWWTAVILRRWCPWGLVCSLRVETWLSLAKPIGNLRWLHVKHLKEESNISFHLWDDVIGGVCLYREGLQSGNGFSFLFRRHSNVTTSLSNKPAAKPEPANLPMKYRKSHLVAPLQILLLLKVISNACRKQTFRSDT